MEYIASVRSTVIPEFDIDLFNFLSKSIEGAELYEMKKSPVMASVDRAVLRQRMRIVIGDVNAVAGILSLALTTYQTYIASQPPQSAPQERPVISVTIQNAGKNNVFHFGTEIKNEPELLKKLRDSLVVTQAQVDLAKAKIMLDSIRNTDEWKRINK